MTHPQLLEKLASGTATPADYQQFTTWFEGLDDATQQEVLLQYEALIMQQSGGTVPPTIAQKIAARVQAHEQQQQKGRVLTMIRIAATTAAAAVLAGITWLAWPTSKTTQPATASHVTTPPIQDKEPATSGAILTLADGSTILLDTLQNGNIASESGVAVTKKDGQVIYTPPSSSRLVPSHETPTTAYNTMSTPRGRQFQLILPDGSKVWLNAASSIHYPTTFTGRDRRVSITGEAYFEVAKNANMPFKVSFHTAAAGDGEVEVLGTHFNINAYEDETSIKTTLLEGKVKVGPVDKAGTSPMVMMTLAPGKQAILSKTTAQTPALHTQAVDTEAVTAWKNGRFQFDDTSIKDILRQAARWYDVEVIYTQTIPEKKFTADLSRQTRLSEFLKVLEVSKYRFTIDAKTLKVSM